MAFEDFKSKESVIVVYTGDGKGKTSASIGLTARALGTGWKVAYVQFIKYWDVGEHQFFSDIAEIYTENFAFYKGGLGFYDAGDLSASDTTELEHIRAATKTYEFAQASVSSGDYRLVVCDEINNAAHDGLLPPGALQQLITSKHPATSLCLTGRNFPDSLLPVVDIATDMSKLAHHFDQKFLANKGIDY